MGFLAIFSYLSAVNYMYEIMRCILFFIVLFVMSGSLWAESSVVEKLKQIKEISGIKEMKEEGFVEYYEFWFEQPIDHADPSKGSFKQRVLLGHKDFTAPMVVELEGYGIHSSAAGELTRLFNTNQLVIEHRFFNNSKPEGKTPWECLTLKQAATDQHRIIQALREKVYPGTRWISTGISKGGQTVVYHRYFYPNDVEISVPYVAPINMAYIDPRLEKFLEKLGNTPENKTLLGGGGMDQKWQIFDFQKRCFERLAQLQPLFDAFVQKKGFTFNRVGGNEQALRMVILEFPFAFWQWGNDLNDMPEEETETMEELFAYLSRVSDPGFFSDQSIEDLQAFYYAALTETGMYAYNVKPFKEYFPKMKKKQITFRYALPEGYENVGFNTEQLLSIGQWLQTDAERILFIYGGIDPWTATAAELGGNSKCEKYIKADGSHLTRINSFEKMTQQVIIETLKDWLNGTAKRDEVEKLVY